MQYANHPIDEDIADSFDSLDSTEKKLGKKQDWGFKEPKFKKITKAKDTPADKKEDKPPKESVKV